jgi:hypothetical protein
VTFIAISINKRIIALEAQRATHNEDGAGLLPFQSISFERIIALEAQRAAHNEDGAGMSMRSISRQFGPKLELKCRGFENNPPSESLRPNNRKSALHFPCSQER